MLGWLQNAQNIRLEVIGDLTRLKTLTPRASQVPGGNSYHCTNRAVKNHDNQFDREINVYS